MEHHRERHFFHCFQFELEFRNVRFHGGRKAGGSGGKVFEQVEKQETRPTYYYGSRVRTQAIPASQIQLLNMIHQFFLQILVCWRCSWTYNYPSVDLNLGGKIIIWELLQNFCSSEHVEFYVEFYCSSAVVVYSDQYDWLRLAKFSLKEIEMILSS